MTDARQKIAFIFPGQGSQYPRIGSDLHDQFPLVREIYQQASDTLGYDIAELSFSDPDNQINLTRFTQPVLLTHSYACLRVFQELTDNTVIPDLALGHSLGEYSALVAAQALSFDQALSLVSKRGELMSEHGLGEMEALPLEIDDARLLAEKHYCAIAACNLNNQTVVGGRTEDLDALVEDLQTIFPGKRSARLKTEGAFHTYYMVKAAQSFRTTLEQAEFSSPTIPVLSNYTGEIHQQDIDGIRSRLFFQLIHPVMWHANLRRAAEHGASTFIEFGGGIGKGEVPADKRANLESIVKKAFRGTDYAVKHASIINCESLARSSAEL